MLEVGVLSPACRYSISIDTLLAKNNMNVERYCSSVIRNGILAFS
jgi:hypothetical protein